jgi:hypothetical protein
MFLKIEVLRAININKKSYNKSVGFLTRIGLKPKTISQTLMQEHIKGSKKYLRYAKDSIKSFKDELKRVLQKASSSIPSSKRVKVVKRIIGEFIVENKEAFISGVSYKEQELLKGYQEQVKSNLNHPYKISSNSEARFKQAIFKAKSA